MCSQDWEPLLHIYSIYLKVFCVAGILNALKLRWPICLHSDEKNNTNGNIKHLHLMQLIHSTFPLPLRKWKQASLTLLVSHCGGQRLTLLVSHCGGLDNANKMMEGPPSFTQSLHCFQCSRVLGMKIVRLMVGSWKHNEKKTYIEEEMWMLKPGNQH